MRPGRSTLAALAVTVASVLPWACARGSPPVLVPGVTAGGHDAADVASASAATPRGPSVSRGRLCTLPRAATASEARVRGQLIERYPLATGALDNLSASGWLKRAEPAMPPNAAGLIFLMDAAATLNAPALFATPQGLFENDSFRAGVGQDGLSEDAMAKGALEALACAPVCLYDRVIFPRAVDSLDAAHERNLELLKLAVRSPVCPLARGAGFDVWLPFQALVMLQNASNGPNGPPLSELYDALRERPRDEATMPLLLYLGTLDCPGAQMVARDMKVELPSVQGDPQACANFHLSSFPALAPDVPEFASIASFTPPPPSPTAALSGSARPSDERASVTAVTTYGEIVPPPDASGGSFSFAPPASSGRAPRPAGSGRSGRPVIRLPPKK